MINGKEIRPCWSDLSIFISFHCSKKVEEEKNRLWVLLFGGDGVALLVMVIYFLMTLHLLYGLRLH